MTYTIYHGDCLDLMETIPMGSIDFVLTDPPYGVDYQGRWCSDWDKMQGDAALHWIEATFAAIYDRMKPDSLMVSFYGWPHVDAFMGAWKRVGLRPISHLAFLKPQMGLGYWTRSKHETAYLLAKGKPKRLRTAIPDVFPWKRVRNAQHPTQKPLEALRPVIAQFSNPGDLVFDPFMGVGSVGAAALLEGRRFVGAETKRGYFDLAQAGLHTVQAGVTTRVLAA